MAPGSRAEPHVEYAMTANKITATPFISFEHGTEARRKQSRQTVLPEFVRLSAFYPDTVRRAITTPYPAFAFPTFPNENFTLGAYTCTLAGRLLTWSAPGRPAVFDETELEDGVLVLTGAGSITLPGTGDCYVGVPLGSVAVIFDANGIGALALSGDMGVPFSYVKPITNIYTDSQVHAVEGAVYFVGHDGRIWQTNGFTATPMDGPMNVALTDVGWPTAGGDAAFLSFALNPATNHFVISDGTTTLYVDRDTGAYGTSGSTVYAETGVLPLQSEMERVHAQRVRLYWEQIGSGASTVTVSCKGFNETSWTDYGTGALSAAGNYETELSVNYSKEMPQFKFTVTTTATELVLYGIVVLHGEGGLR